MRAIRIEQKRGKIGKNKVKQIIKKTRENENN